MQQFDTIKFTLPVDAVQGINKGAFIQNSREDLGNGGIESMMQAKSGSLPSGISGISYKEGEQFIVKMSAKVLKDQYLQGINLNTWEQAISNLSPIMQVDPGKVWESGNILSCDATNNLSLSELGGNRKAVHLALLAGRRNDRFVPLNYESSKKSGIEFRGTQQEKNRLIIYAKHLDLLKPANRQFMQSLSNPTIMLQDAANQVRIESNHTSFKAMRDRFGAGENTFAQMLTSSKPVNYDFLKKILQPKGQGQLNIFDQFQDFTGSGIDFIHLKGLENIIIQLAYDDNTIKAFFRQVFPDDNSFKYHYYKKKFNVRQILSEMKANQLGIKTDEMGRICTMVLDSLLKSVA